MPKVQLPPPEVREMIEFCIDRFKTYHIWTGNDGRFYESDDIGSYEVPVNHVRCMLQKDLHANYFVTPKVRKVVIDKVIEAIFLWARKNGEKR